ncbi:MAG: DUF1801 domain-containing protein [Spirochaetales bacterium]|nr:DUF1801 domain-containing protein [Spirochaetales bacterium]
MEETTSIEQYIESAPEKWRKSIILLRKIIKDNLPKRFEETMNYGMIGYVVPKHLYPQGYHAKKGEPLPFINIAAQKNHLSLYHLGIYINEELHSWFIESYEKSTNKKINMGKSCIRFKKDDDIPYDLIQALVKKITVEEWIRMYEHEYLNK